MTFERKKKRNLLETLENKKFKKKKTTKKPDTPMIPMGTVLVCGLILNTGQSTD